ncbi:MAG: creatininase family protein, partial [Boseongicola sp. SB0673_bin_14]|nr:creatininase family protein [Boseongicola sp. SB0673_bin_14]
MSLPTRIFADLTQPEIKAQLKANPLVLFPCGSVEQHSAHLPASTDMLAATRVCELVAELMDGLVLPAPSVGVTPLHMPYE